MKRELDNIDKHILALIKINGELGSLQYRLFEAIMIIFNLKRNHFDIEVDEEDKTFTFKIKKKVLDKFNQRDRKLLKEIYSKFYKVGMVINKRSERINKKYEGTY